jgi:hypothetical protein
MTGNRARNRLNGYSLTNEMNKQHARDGIYLCVPLKCSVVKERKWNSKKELYVRPYKNPSKMKIIFSFWKGGDV